VRSKYRLIYLLGADAVPNLPALHDDSHDPLVGIIASGFVVLYPTYEAITKLITILRKKASLVEKPAP
jgi:hypothetical protein